MLKKISIICSVLLVLSGCGTKEIRKKTADIFSGPKSRITVIDESGQKFTVVRRPSRIISTVPSNTEILFSLGLRDRIIGVTTQCNYPPEARNIQKVGGVTLSTEKIISLNPDLILMLGDAQKNDIEKLRLLQLPVFVINPQTLPELIDSIRLLGRVTGSQKEAGNLAKKMQEDIFRVSRLEKLVPKPKVFVVLWDNPLITAGKGTFIDDLLVVAGAQNIASGMRGKYPIMSTEVLIEEDPDCIIIAGKSKEDIKKVKNKNPWKLLKAVKGNRILLIDSDIITRPSPRLMTALDLIAGFIREKGLR